MRNICVALRRAQGGTESSWGGNVPRWLVPVLTPLSWLYEAGLEAYLLPYRLDMRKRHELPCRVVSVGNLTFGGTGKSPTVRAICEKLLEHALMPAVLSRGHGGRLSTAGAVVSDGSGRVLQASDCGDEPALLADALPGVPVAIGKDRKRMGRMLVDQFKPDVVVLDDGMQYWQLARDIEIVLVDARYPFGSGRVLPAGNLREPVRGLRRADVVIVTGTEAVNNGQAEQVADKLASLAPQAEIFTAHRAPTALIDAKTRERLPLDAIDGMSVLAVSGIANPASFDVTLRSCGAEIRGHVRFGDHCAYSYKEVELVNRALDETKAEAVVTTAKDAVKLKPSTQMYVLDVEMIIENVDRLIDLVVEDH